jgi:hypothetical protein
MAPSAVEHVDNRAALGKDSPINGHTFCSRSNGPGMMKPPKPKGQPDTPRQKAMLGHIVSRPGIGTRVLADVMGMNMQCTLRMLARLVDSGLVQDRGTKRTAKEWHPL